MAAWPGVHFATASVEDADSLLDALRPHAPIAGIFHLAGLVEHSRRRPEVMYRVHVAGTLNVLRTALDLVRARSQPPEMHRDRPLTVTAPAARSGVTRTAQGIRRVVYASTSGTVACSNSMAPIGDDAPYATTLVRTWPYYHSKIVAEQEAADFVRRYPQLELVVMRPTLVLGPGDDRRSSVTLIDEFLKGRIPLVPSGGLSYVDVRDAAAAFRAAMAHQVRRRWSPLAGDAGVLAFSHAPDAVWPGAVVLSLQGAAGRSYLISATNVTHADLYKQLERISGVRAPRLRLPGVLVVWLLRILYFILRLLGIWLKEKDPVWAEMGNVYWSIDASRAKRELGFQPRPPEETLRATIDWLRSRSPR